MKSIFEKLGLYDLLGYIIPGFLGVLSSKVIFLDIFQLPYPLDLEDSFINSLIFLVISYFVGTIMHEISQMFQKIFLKIWGGWPSEKVLLKEDKIFCEKEKNEYWLIAEEHFGIKQGDYDKQKSQLVFDKFRTSLQLAGNDEKAQLFNSYFGMYRNFTTASIICSLTYYSYFLQKL